MKGYRRIYRCPECKKLGARKADMTNDILGSPFAWLYSGSAVLCKHCGKRVELERVSAKPRLFGFFGWSVKEGE